MKGWKDNKSIDNLSDRLDRLESAKEIFSSNQSVDDGVPYATAVI
ncbi:MAG: hypothetical protein WBL67_00910 [Nitrososphaeraceae archaeon]